MSNSKTINLLENGWRLMPRNWRQMVVYTVIIWMINLVVLGPPISWVLTKLGSSGPDVIVGNYGITSWLLSVQGMSYVLLAGCVIPFSIILYIVGLFRLANASVDQSAMSICESLIHVLTVIPRLLRFSLYVFAAFLISALILGIGIGVIYLLLLTRHDINYYMTAHPPQWYWALAMAGGWILCVGIPVVYILLRNAFILPIWLEGNHTVRDAFRISWEKTRGKIKPLARVFGLFLVIWLLSDLVLKGVVFALAGYVLKNWVSSVNGILFVIAGHLLVCMVIDAVLNFIGLAWYICIWVVFYRRVMGLETEQKSVSGKPSEKLNIRSELLNFLRPRILVPIAAVLFIVSGVLSLWMFHTVSDQPPKVPLVIAHRAGAANAPENSLAALDRAIQDGASDFIEIDVQLTRDDVIVVTHDTDLMKIGNAPQKIRQTDYAELSQIDIGSHFGPEFVDQRLRKLSDFLEAGKDKATFIIEFKQSAGTDLIEKTIAVVQEYGMQDDVTFMSLDLNDIRKTQQVAPEFPIGYLVVTEVGDLKQLDVAFLAVQEKKVTPQMLGRLKSRNETLIYAWTVNTDDRMLELIEMGIDGLITDRPARVAEISEKYQQLNPVQRALLSYRRFWNIFREMGIWKEPEVSYTDDEL